MSSYIVYNFYFYCNLFSILKHNIKVIGLNGLEPLALRLSSVYSNQLSYRPNVLIKIIIGLAGLEPTTYLL